MTSSLQNFIKTGKLPATERARAALLHESRSQLADYDRIERQSKAVKQQREQALKNTEEAYRKQREQRQAIERKAAAKKAPAKAPSLLDRLAKLTGDAATAFYRANRAAILAESENKKFLKP